MKKVLLAFGMFLMAAPANADITHKLSTSVQLTVDSPVSDNALHWQCLFSSGIRAMHHAYPGESHTNDQQFSNNQVIPWQKF